VYSAHSALPLRFITLLMPVSSMQTTPPAVNAIHRADGTLAGLRLLDRNASILVDDDEIVAHTGEMEAAGISGGGI
jgi:hypothetical protein